MFNYNKFYKKLTMSTMVIANPTKRFTQMNRRHGAFAWPDCLSDMVRYFAILAAYSMPSTPIIAYGIG